MKRRSIAALFAAYLASGYCESAVPPVGAVPPRLEDAVKVTVATRQGEFVAGEGFDLEIEVEVTDDRLEAAMTALDINIPASLRHLRPDLVGEKTKIHVSSLTDIAVPKAYGLSFKFSEPIKLSGAHPRWVSTIGFPAADADPAIFRRILSPMATHSIRVCAQLEHQDPTVAGKFWVWAAPKTIDFEPPGSAIYLGGLCGAALLVIFDWCLVRSARSEGKTGIKRRKGYYAAMWASGAATSVILILLSTRLEDVSLPLNLQVNDFLGGLIVGLLSAQLLRGLSERLFPEPIT